MKDFWSKFSTGDIRNTIAVLSVLGAFGVVVLIALKPIPIGNKESVNMALGFVLGGLIGGVNGYYFGASKREPDDKPKTP